MRSPNLSYLMATRNKLTFLRHTLPRLLSNLQEDEEIVIIDGGSTDGAAEHLRDLHAAGKIHQFLSEPDKGEAHAFNKGLLMVKGELVKFISDDDVFHFPTIQRCKEYMLRNSEVDILGTEGGFTYCGMKEPVGVTTTGQDYDRWTREGRPFWFSGIGMMLRRRSLPLLGLLLTAIIHVDQEYPRRVTSLPVCMAWCSGLSFIHFRSPASNEIRLAEAAKDEVSRFQRFYGCEDPPAPLWHRIIEPVRRAFRPIKKMLVRSAPNSFSLAPVTDELIRDTFNSCSDWLDKQNTSQTCSLRKAVRATQGAKESVHAGS